MSLIPIELDQWYQQATNILIGKFPVGMAYAMSTVNKITAVYSPELSLTASAFARSDGVVTLVFPAFLSEAKIYYRLLEKAGRGKGVSPEVAFLAFVLAEEILHVLLMHCQRVGALIELGYPRVLVDSAAHTELAVIMREMGFVLTADMLLPHEIGLPPTCVAMEDIVKALAEKLRGRESSVAELNEQWLRVIERGESVCAGEGVEGERGVSNSDESMGYGESEVKKLAKRLGVPLPNILSPIEEQETPYSVGVVDARRFLESYISQRPGLFPLGEKIFSSPPPRNLLWGLASMLSNIAQSGQPAWARRIDPKLSMATGAKIPSIRHKEATLGVVVDTSGSMLMRLGGRKLVDEAVSIALGAKGLGCNAWIVPCDVQGYRPFRPTEYQGVVYGGGGTVLWEGVKTLFDEHRYPYLPKRYDAIIVITDGYSFWPDSDALAEFVQQHRTKMFMILLDAAALSRLPDYVRGFFDVRICLT